MKELTSEQKKQLLRAGYPVIETLRMVEMKLQGLGNEKIAQKWGKSKSAVRHQLAFYEKITGETLPRHCVTKVKTIRETTAEYEYELEYTQAENVIASRRLSFDNFDDEYFYAVLMLSYRVKCPACGSKKRQVCKGTSIEMTGYHAPCHKSRLRLLKFSSEKVNDNLRYAMRSKKWKGDWVLIKQDGEWFQVYCKENDWRERVKETYGI